MITKIVVSPKRSVRKSREMCTLYNATSGSLSVDHKVHFVLKLHGNYGDRLS